MANIHRWIVGTDVRPASEALLRFAGWLHAYAPDSIELLALHVAETEPFSALDRLARPTELSRQRSQALSDLIIDAGIVARFEIVEVGEPGNALEEASEQVPTSGLIVGRRATASGTELIRLGGTVRRLLRRLVAPTFVVPPDLEVARLGGGPLVVAFSPDESSVGAMRVATSLAQTMARSILPVHVTRPDTPTVAVEPWLAAQGHAGEFVARRGDVLAELLATASEHAAPFLVCGSRKLGMVERVFAGSLSSELAAHAQVPVLAVPPDVGLH